MGWRLLNDRSMTTSFSSRWRRYAGWLPSTAFFPTRTEKASVRAWRSELLYSFFTARRLPSGVNKENSTPGENLDRPMLVMKTVAYRINPWSSFARKNQDSVYEKSLSG